MCSYSRAGHASQELVGGDEGTFGFELAAGVGAGGGQPGSIVMAGHSIIVDHPCGTRVSLGGETRRYASRRRVATSEPRRSGGGGPPNRPPPVKSGRDGFRINMYEPNIFRGRCPDPCFRQNPPLFGKSVPTHRHECLKQCAWGHRNGTLLIKAPPLAAQTTGVRVQMDATDHLGVGKHAEKDRGM
jgi:hypothetical protein